MAGGRPRTVSPPPDELEALGVEMVNWVEENKPIHLCEWYSFQKFFTDNAWKTMICRQEFVGYYEKALKLVGMRYIDGNCKKVKDNICQRWQRVYFKDLKAEEDDTVKYNESVKAAQVQQGDTYVVYSGDSAAYKDGQVPPKTISEENPQCPK